MTSPAEARQLLEVDAGADAETVRAARRRLAKAVHPDAGGDDERMRRLNEAAEVLLLDLAAAGAVGRTATDERPATSPASRPRRPGGTASDNSSFVIEALPVEAFEALLVVTSWLGEVIVDEPPYQLDVLLLDPLRCWCRLDLVPDAGASTVGLTIAALVDEPLPELDDVRDLWVASLNRLGPGPE